MFKIIGKFKGKRGELSWDGGEVSGSDAALARYEIEQRRNNQHVYVPTLGSLSNGNSSDPLACYILMTRILFPVESTEGNIPLMPSVPEGAVS